VGLRFEWEGLWDGNQGETLVTHVMVRPQLSHTGFPMDGALLGAGSPTLSAVRWISTRLYKVEEHVMENGCGSQL